LTRNAGNDLVGAGCMIVCRGARQDVVAMRATPDLELGAAVMSSAGI